MKEVKRLTYLVHKEYWGENGGYYRKKPSELVNNPLPLPSRDKPFFRKLEMYLFKYLPQESNISLFEIGCGCSVMLPYFKKKWDYKVSGIDYNSFAAQLAKANLEAHGVEGKVYSRDIFDAHANEDLESSFNIIYSQGVVEHFGDAVTALKEFGKYLKKDGYIVTVVPNLQGINYLVQKFVDGEILKMHVLHDKKSLRVSHERAGYLTLFCEYIGVYDGWMTEGESCKNRWKKGIHWMYCYITNVLINKVLKYTKYGIMPEFSFISPYVLYIGKKQTRARSRS